MIKKIFYLIFLLLAQNILWAQFPQLTPAVQPEMAWRNDKIILSNNDSFTILNPSNLEPTVIPLPPNTVDNRFAQDYFWIVREDAALSTLRIYRSEDANKWEFVASWSAVADIEGKIQRHRFFLHPLGNSAFLLVARASGEWFNVDGKPCPIVIAKVNDKKELKPTQGVDLGLSEKLAWYKDGKLIFNEHYIWFFSCIINRPFLTVDDKVFLAFRRIGTFMEIRPGGNVGRTFRIIPGLEEKITADPDQYDWATLCSQPTKNGEILVLARTPDGVLEGRKRFPRSYTLAAMKDSVVQEVTRRSDLEALQAYPFMDWWTLDPSNGQIYRAASPMNVPLFFNSIDEFRKFVFHFNPAGNLIFPLLKK